MLDTTPPGKTRVTSGGGLDDGERDGDDDRQTDEQGGRGFVLAGSTTTSHSGHVVPQGFAIRDPGSAIKD